MPCCFDGTNVSPKLIDVTQSSKRQAFSPNLKKLKYPEKETSVTNTGQLISIYNNAKFWRVLRFYKVMGNLMMYEIEK